MTVLCVVWRRRFSQLSVETCDDIIRMILPKCPSCRRVNTGVGIASIKSRQLLDQSLPLLVGQLACVEITQGQNQSLPSRRVCFLCQAVGQGFVSSPQASQPIDDETPQRGVLSVLEQGPHGILVTDLQ